MGLAVIVTVIPMASNGKPQFLKQVFSQQSNGAAGEAVNAAVRQDKARGESARRGTRPPAAGNEDTRAQHLHRNIPHTQLGAIPQR